MKEIIRYIIAHPSPGVFLAVAAVLIIMVVILIGFVVLIKKYFTSLNNYEEKQWNKGNGQDMFE